MQNPNINFCSLKAFFVSSSGFFLAKAKIGGFEPKARASWGKCHLRKVPVGKHNLSDFLSTIFILIYFYPMNATVTNEHYYLSKIKSMINKF